MSVDSIKTVAVLGAGTMGNGIAHVFARAGYQVILRDVEQCLVDRGMDTIGQNLAREVKKGKITEAERSNTLERLLPVTARARSFPLRMWLIIAASPGMASDTCPPSRSVVACALPLYGTCVSLMSAMDVNIAVKRCCALPFPDDP